MSNASNTSKTPNPGTPAVSEKGKNDKRQLTSPFDPNDPKKARSLSESSDTSDASESPVRLSSEDLEAIHAMLTSTFDRKFSEMNVEFESKISGMVSSITDGVIHGLNVKIEKLESENTMLKEKVLDLEKRLDQADEMQDRANQYSRRNCLRLSGIKETRAEDTDQLVLDVAKAVGAEITLDEIDRSHRLGPPSSPDASDRTPANSTKPRDIIVKFVSYRSRSNLYKNKSKLRQTSFKGSFVNEDLTRTRSDIFYQCRVLVRNKRVQGTWTSDGVILVKDNRNKVHRVETRRQFDHLKSKLE